jgi:hypothetical protein
MSPAAKEYILEERFIHEVLARRAHNAYERACQIWQTDGHLSPGILFWPTDTVMTTDRASPLEGVLVGPLPDPKERPALFASALEVISPYGIFTVELVGEPGPPALVGTFETSHGARQWVRPVQRHGDVSVLGPEVVTDNRQHLGVLWAPNRGAA